MRSKISFYRLPRVVYKTAITLFLVFIGCTTYAQNSNILIGLKSTAYGTIRWRQKWEIKRDS